MRRLLPALLAAGIATSAGVTLCAAQDSPPPPPPPAPRDEAPPAPKSDPEALALLEKAAQRQGGAALAEPGSLQSFRVEFGRVKVRRRLDDDLGAWDEASALNIDWMRNDGKPSSLKTYWEINGRKVTRGVLGTRDYFWIYDGTESNQLSAGTHDADREEVLLHRRLSETLLDVAVLHKLLRDGSVWKKVADTTYDGNALRRTPAPGSSGLRLTIWLDPETADPHHVRVDPIEDDAPTLHYELTYVADKPTIEGATLRFPFEVAVRESDPKDTRAPEETMHLWVKRVVFNKGEVADFVPPK